MSGDLGTSLYHGVFRWQALGNGRGRVTAHESPPASIPDPRTGIELRIATLEAGTDAACPACASVGQGGFVSFVADLRLAYACPHCRQLVWLSGA